VYAALLVGLLAWRIQRARRRSVTLAAIRVAQ